MGTSLTGGVLRSWGPDLPDFYRITSESEPFAFRDERTFRSPLSSGWTRAWTGGVGKTSVEERDDGGGRVRRVGPTQYVGGRDPKPGPLVKLLPHLNEDRTGHRTQVLLTPRQE